MAKTIKVVDLIEKVNRKNRVSTCSPDVRAGWNDLLATVLMDTNNYAGFRWLTASEIPVGEKPGIAGEHPNFTFPDETRKAYFVAKKLCGQNH